MDVLVLMGIIGLIWDGSYRHLCVDEVSVASDATSIVGIDSDGGLYSGAGEDLDAASFFAGLIDDVRIYNRAITP